MKILGSEVLRCIFGTLVQDGLAQMRGVTWRAVISNSFCFDIRTLNFLAFAMPTRH